MAVPVIENQTFNTAQTNDFNFNHTGTGSDLLAVVVIGQVYGANTGIVGITYGGNAMTRAVAGGANGMGYVYYLLAAPSGVQSVAVDVVAGAVGRACTATALTITGAATSSVVDSTASYSGASDNSITVDMTTNTNDVLVITAVGASTGTDPTVTGTGHTELYTGTQTSGFYGFGYVSATTAGTITALGYNTTSNTNDFGLAIAGFKAAGASTTVKTYNAATTATVKSVLNGTLIANRKTWNSIT